MKVDEIQLRKEIEEIISEGAFNGEEVDITINKIMKAIEPLIDVVKCFNFNQTRILK